MYPCTLECLQVSVFPTSAQGAQVARRMALPQLASAFSTVKSGGLRHEGCLIGVLIVRESDYFAAILGVPLFS